MTEQILIENKILGILEESKNLDVLKKTLVKQFILECKSNLKLLAIIQLRNFPAGSVKFVTQKLSSECAKIFFTMSDQSTLAYLLDPITAHIDIESEVSGQNKNSRISSLITSIDALKLLAELFDDLKNEESFRFNIRVKNAEKILIEVVCYLDQIIAKPKKKCIRICIPNFRFC